MTYGKCPDCGEFHNLEAEVTCMFCGYKMTISKRESTVCACGATYDMTKASEKIVIDLPRSTAVVHAPEMMEYYDEGDSNLCMVFVAPKATVESVLADVLTDHMGQGHNVGRVRYMGKLGDLDKN